MGSLLASILTAINKCPAMLSGNDCPFQSAYSVADLCSATLYQSHYVNNVCRL